MQVCKVEGCGLKVRSIHMCGNHYNEQRRNNETRICKADGCNNKYGAKGYCHHHYYKLVRKPGVKPVVKAMQLDEQKALAALSDLISRRKGTR